jgi:hypothetical protein
MGGVGLSQPVASRRATAGDVSGELAADEQDRVPNWNHFLLQLNSLVTGSPTSVSSTQGRLTHKSGPIFSPRSNTKQVPHRRQLSCLHLLSFSVLPRRHLLDRATGSDRGMAWQC